MLDPAAFAQDGGPSIAERMYSRKVVFRPADNSRGRALGRARWLGHDARPHSRAKAATRCLVVFDTCKDFIRTVPGLQHDPDRPRTSTRSRGPRSRRDALRLPLAAVAAGQTEATEAGSETRPGLPARPAGAGLYSQDTDLTHGSLGTRDVAGRLARLAHQLRRHRPDDYVRVLSPSTASATAAAIMRSSASACEPRRVDRHR